MAQNTGAEVKVIQYWNQSEVKSNKLDYRHLEIQEVAEKLGIKVTQTGKKFQQASEAKLELFRDKIHPTDEGQKLLAESMMEVLNPE